MCKKHKVEIYDAELDKFAKFLELLLKEDIEAALQEEIEKRSVDSMTSDEFLEFTETVYGDIFDLFHIKNKQYASNDDVFEALKEQAIRQYGEVSTDTVLDVILALKDKHDVAILNHGTELEDLRDRLLDIIVYSLLALAWVSREEE